MGRSRRWGRPLGLLRLIASLAAICTGGLVGRATALPGDNRVREAAEADSSLPGLDSAVPPWGADHTPHHTSCPSPAKTPDHFVLMVSTIDGAVSALDMRNSGQILWTVRPDDHPLLSSSISNIQIKKNGVLTRLIPSLDGSLYEFDGQQVKAMPTSADSLLSASIRINDNYVMVGGKDVSSYGVDLKTGQMLYLCTAKGCNETSEARNDEGDMLVVTRNIKTVRAVDVSTGIEKWNFSVGQHDLLFVEAKIETPEEGFENNDIPQLIVGDAESDEEDVFTANCTPDDELLRLEEEQMLKQMIKVVVSDGMIVGMTPEDPSQMSWSHKFSSPVAKVWILHRGKLQPVNLFDTKVVPALSSGGQPFHRPNLGNPLLYVGTHQRQLYVQTQDVDPNSCEQEVPWSSDRVNRPGTDSLPFVSWRPYLITKYQTPIFGGNTAPDFPLLSRKDEKDVVHQDGDLDESGSGSSLTVWHENYPFDMGYYLYPHSEKPIDTSFQVPPAEEEGILDAIPASLWNWWKEVVAISLLTSVFVHILLTRVVNRPLLTEGSSQSLESKESSGSLISSESSLGVQQSPTEYKSRFGDEFDCLEQLGKGGFGIVFRAKNKVDDQEYAVKRIALPNTDDGTMKTKMLREVRILAMLDHIGIVRYFHSWIEDPPTGWQEDRDKTLQDTTETEDCFTPTEEDTTIPSADLTDNSHLLSSHSPQQNNVVKRQPSLLANIMPCAARDFDNDSQLFPPSLTASGSGEFSVHSNVEGATDESGSFSLDGGDSKPRGLDLEESKDSFSVVFENSKSSREFSEGGELDDLSGSGQSLVPFKHYESLMRGEASGSVDPDNEDSVLFQDSQGHSHSDLQVPGDQSWSFVFSDSSYGGSVGDNESGDNNLSDSHPPVEFTLSSHRFSDEKHSKNPAGHSRHHHSRREEHEVDRRKKKVSAKDKASAPKLYLYLQMQLCRLETLKDWLTSNTLNRERIEILDIFEQIVSAVQYVHSKGLIHRDLKPSNIFFALDGIVKVGDFGLGTAAENQVELVSSQQNLGKQSSARHTAEVGTQLYMSPEQVQKKTYDQKVDIFSLGLIFLELLMPFSTSMERVSTLQKARNGKFPERFCRELPAESGLVRQLTSGNPQKRPTAQEILEHHLLQDFIPRRISFQRNRTISNSSNKSKSEPIMAT